MATFVEKGPNTMKGWGMERPTGDVAGVEVAHAVIPTPGPREVRVKMVAATTNPVDWKRATFGDWPAYPSFFGVDGAGIVDAVGTEVTSRKVGDRVHFFNDLTKAYGSFADYSIVHEYGAVPVPDNVSLEAAAVVPCAGWTAYEALFDRLRVEAGKTLVVNAAAGGVGLFAVQLAVHKGVRVIAIASGTWCEFLKQELKVVDAIDYKQESDIPKRIKELTGGAGADYALDSVDADSARMLLSSLAFGGQLVHIACTVEPPKDGIFMQALSTHHVFIPGHYFYGEAQLKKFHQLGVEFDALLSSGVIKCFISKTIEFNAIQEQLFEQRNGVVKGKVLIRLEGSTADIHQDAHLKFI